MAHLYKLFDGKEISILFTVHLKPASGIRRSQIHPVRSSTQVGDELTRK